MLYVIFETKTKVLNSRYQKGIMALILWQYLKWIHLQTLLTVHENCLQHSLELGNC